MRTLFLWLIISLAPGLAEAAPRDADPDTEIARRHFLRGSHYYDQQDYEAAINEFTAAQRVRPAPAFDYNIGRCLDRMERYAEAVSSYERFLAAEPDAPDAAELRGRVVLLKKRLAENALRAASAPPGAPPSSVVVPSLPPAPRLLALPLVLAPPLPLPLIDERPAPVEPAPATGRPARRPLMNAGIGLVVAGVAVGVGGGVGFGVAAAGQAKSLVDGANTNLRYDPSINAAGVTFQTLSIVSAAVGGALALTGAVLAARGARRGRGEGRVAVSSAAGPTLWPTAGGGPGMASAGLAGSF